MKQEKLRINWNYVVIGLITKKGFTNEELIDILNISHSTLSNWLNFHTSLDKENTIKIYDLISKLKLNIFDLEEIGKTNWKTLIESIKKELKIGDYIIASSLKITPSLMRSYSKERVPERKNRKLLLDLYQKIKNTKDKRKIIREIYEKSFLTNKYGMLLRKIREHLNLNINEMSKLIKLNSNSINLYERGHLRLSKNVFDKIYQKLPKPKLNKKEISKLILEEKNKWIESKEYPEIINFIQENSQGTKFEIEVYNKLKSIGYFEKIFSGPILSNENLAIKFKADIYAIGKDSKKYIIDTKRHKHPVFAHEIKNCALIKERIKEVNELIIITKGNFPATTKHFKEIGIHIISIDKIEGLKGLLNNKKVTEETNSKLRKIRKNLELSQYQLAKLLEVNTKSIRNWENSKHKCTLDIDQRLNNIQTLAIKSGLPYLKFKANLKSGKIPIRHRQDSWLCSF